MAAKILFYHGEEHCVRVGTHVPELENIGRKKEKDGKKGEKRSYLVTGIIIAVQQRLLSILLIWTESYNFWRIQKLVYGVNPNGKIMWTSINSIYKKTAGWTWIELFCNHSWCIYFNLASSRTYKNLIMLPMQKPV